MSYDDWQQEQGEREYASEERESKDQWRYDAYGDERGDSRATLKQFHTDVLTVGAVGLDVLSEQVRAAQRARWQ